jgi:hypothetical protein
LTHDLLGDARIDHMRGLQRPGDGAHRSGIARRWYRHLDRFRGSGDRPEPSADLTEDSGQLVDGGGEAVRARGGRLGGRALPSGVIHDSFGLRSGGGHGPGQRGGRLQPDQRRLQNLTGLDLLGSGVDLLMRHRLEMFHGADVLGVGARSGRPVTEFGAHRDSPDEIARSAAACAESASS